MNNIIYVGSTIMQVEQDDVQLVKDGLESGGRIRNKKQQEFGMPADFNPLEPHAGGVGGVTGAQKSKE